jgi:hypothetical protein
MLKALAAAGKIALYRHARLSAPPRTSEASTWGAWLGSDILNINRE